jgi:hypothetical protein
MNPILLVHIVAGSLGLVTRFVTLYAAKGAPIHREVGMALLYWVWRVRFRRSARGLTVAERLAPCPN